MASTKPTLPLTSVQALLERDFQAPITALTVVEEGQIAQTFSFTVADQEAFLQFNPDNMNQAGRTEAFFRDRFEQAHIPIRRVLRTGTHEGLAYNVSAKVPGTALTSVGAEGFAASLPSVMEVLGRIGSVSTDDSQGYGWLNEAGNGTFSSWTEHLVGTFDEDPANFHGLWRQLFTTSFLSQETFDGFFAKMSVLLPRLPEVRALIHGDFGYGNVFVKDHRVTAILDWQNARYGDPLWDLAYMLFWRQPAEAALITQAYRAQTGMGPLPPEFASRLRCYWYYIGLDGLRFAAKTNNQGMYDFVVTILEAVETRVI